MDLSLKPKTDDISSFFPLLQRGFFLKTRVGRSVRSLLCEDIGIAPEYVESRIQTIFLNGKPVDDIDSAIVRHGASLALSAAMPGLVGSTFRRGGHLAAFRGIITHEEEASPSPEKEGMVRIKLFNLLVKELGPIFLRKGVWVEKGEVPEKLPRVVSEKIGEAEFANIIINFEEKDN